ncbi:hypothetical protein [Candidatus Steffania adelgidicola]|nr:hypothetical protein [Candidatus Steffania adelgidicola]
MLENIIEDKIKGSDPCEILADILEDNQNKSYEILIATAPEDSKYIE